MLQCKARSTSNDNVVESDGQRGLACSLALSAAALVHSPQPAGTSHLLELTLDALQLILLLALQALQLHEGFSLVIQQLLLAPLLALQSLLCLLGAAGLVCSCSGLRLPELCFQALHLLCMLLLCTGEVERLLLLGAGQLAAQVFKLPQQAGLLMLNALHVR